MEDLNSEKVSSTKIFSSAVISERLGGCAMTRSNIGMHGRDIYYKCVKGVEVRRSDEDIRYWENVEKNFLVNQASSSSLSGEVEDNNSGSE